MSEPTDAPTGGWRITGQQEQDQMTGSGGFAPGYKVLFVTAAGQQGSVWVPQLEFSPARVRELVGQQAALLDHVAGMTSES